ncbi:hypothetical protein D3C77_454380 [compost metagenome]
MKLFKLIALILSIIAVLFTGVVLYILIAEPDILMKSNKLRTAASSVENHNDVSTADKQNASEPDTTGAAAPSSAQPDSSQSAAVDSSSAPEPAGVQPTSTPDPAANQDSSAPASKSAPLQPTPAASSDQDPSALIIGRWQSANSPDAYFEFFQDGTFTRGTYKAKNDYNEYAGTYSFSSGSRLKLQYEKWTIELDSGYKNTRVDDTSHVFDIIIDDNKLEIPDALEVFGTSEWTRDR